MTQDPLSEAEREKYREVWQDERYRKACHSLDLWVQHRHLFPPAPVDLAIDIGCGLGLLVDAWRRVGIDGWGLDLVENALDPDILAAHRSYLIFESLWEWQPARQWDLGVCSDVMEHIPEEKVADVLVRIHQACHTTVFKVAHEDSHFLGHQLHLTQRPWQWWVGQMLAVGGHAEYKGQIERSGQMDSVIVWTRSVSP